MSLIMDALRKAQQFRLKEPRETPSPTHSPSRQKRIRRASGKRWIFVGVAFLIVFSLYIFWQLFLSPPSPLSTLTTARLDKQSPAPAASEKPKEPTRGVLTPELIEGLTDAVSQPKDVSGLPRNALNLSRDVPGLLQTALSFPKDEKPKIVPSISSKAENLEIWILM